MKRIILIITTLFFSINSFCIDREMAKKVAESFFNTQQKVATKAVTEELSLLWESNSSRSEPSEQVPLLYVFGFPEGGYVIVSGNVATRPVLGYSVSGRFDSENISSCEMYWLTFYENVVNAVKDMNPSESIMKEWQQFLSGTNNQETAVVLETAAWAQGEPFNRLCPIVNGQRCPTGCVNTATAIIMRYHKWPESGHGTLPDYNMNGTPMPGHSLGHKYDWEEMPLNYATGYTELQASQVSQLMYDLGIMNTTTYSPGGSGALNGPIKLVKYFDYDPGMLYVSRSFGYSDEEWEVMLKNEIDSGRPVYYSGGNPDMGGHAFVINGYQGRYFSINLGWGSSSTFYTVSPIDELSSDLLLFYTGQSMIINVKPDEGGKQSMPLSMASDIFTNWDYSVNKEFYIERLYVENISALDYECELAYGLIDYQGVIKEIISEPIHAKAYPGFTGFDRIKCIITQELAQDDMIAACYKDIESGEWAMLPATESQRYTMIHDESIHSSTSLEYRYYYDHHHELWSEIALYVPYHLSFDIFEDDHQLFDNIHDAVSHHKDGFVITKGSQIQGKHTLSIQCRKQDIPQKFKLRLYDMREEYYINIVF